MSVKKYMELSSRQVKNMSEKELRKAITVLDSAANKRIKRAFSKGAQSAVMENIIQDGKFSIKGLTTREELESAYTRVRGYMEKETSSLTGIRKSQKKAFKELAKEVNKELPQDEKINMNWTKDKTDSEIKDVMDLVWTQVDKLAENKQYNIGKSDRYKIAAHAFQVATRSKRPIGTKRGLFKHLEKFYKDTYTKSVEETDDLGEMTSGEQNIASIFSGNGFT